MNRSFARSPLIQAIPGRFALAFAFAIAVLGCQDATQVNLEMSTDALCTDVRDTSITVAEASALETDLPDTTTRRCEASSGRIGTLAVVPTNGDSAPFSVRVVAGLGKSADQCVEDGYMGGCIVARRSLRFIPHKTLHLPIELEVVCKDIPCGATETCRHGHCVADTIANVDDCTSANGCDIAAGGAPATGGARSVGAGGVTSQGTTGGSTSIGGAPIAGGTTSATSSETTGGTAPTGGRASTPATTDTSGGSQQTGGASTWATGAAPTGGNPASGGTSSAVASVTGGTNATGGTSATGGVTPTGGTADTGGASPSGGTSSGGSSSTGGAQATGGASATGGTTSICGDGIVDAYVGEYCDSKGESPTCNANCTAARCGDGITNSSASEACDGSTASVHCTPACKVSTCGDGYVDAVTGEQCESGGGCVGCKQDVAGQNGNLRVLAKRSELLPHDVNLDLQISNSGPAVAESGLKLRYYYNADNSNAQSASCGLLDASCSISNYAVVPLKSRCSNATHYIEVTFTTNANLGTNASISVQGSASGGLLNLYDFSNDYSRPDGILLYQEAPTITLYQNGKLVWGTPPCGCGNGALEPGEQCDNEGESSYCNKDCTLALCGDGKVNASAGETCDEGKPSLTCDPECHATGLPSSAASALVQWVDASWAPGIVLSPHVSSIRDRSPAGNALNQVDPDKQPYWFPNAFGTRPALYFNGIKHELSAASSVNNVGKGSVLIVHSVKPVGVTATLIANGWASSGGGFSMRTRPQLDGLGFAFGAASGYSTQLWTLGARTGSAPPQPRATYFAWNPPNFDWQSGSSGESLVDSGVYTSTTNALSYGGITASEPFTGWLGEVLVFNRALTSTERDQLLAYLKSKWLVQ